MRFDICLEREMRKTKINKGSLMKNRIQYLASADDVGAQHKE